MLNLEEALLSVSFLLAAYQDIRGRWISDYVWAPALVGGAVLILRSVGPLLALLTIKLLILVALSYAWRRLGLMADADLIAFPLVSLSRNVLSPLPELVVGLIVALIYVVMAKIKYGKLERTLKPQEALEQSVWIPTKVVDLSTHILDERKGRLEDAWSMVEKYASSDNVVVVAGYGVPLAAFLGVGYVTTRVFEALVGTDPVSIILA